MHNSRPGPVFLAEKLVLTTPEFESKTVAEASAWYREQMDNLAGIIDKKLSVEEHIIQADQLSRLILKGARASLYDQGPKVANMFEAEFLPPTIARLRTDLSASGITDNIKLNEEILKKLTAPVDEALKWFEFGGTWACFAAGTLVHTKEGLVPIENIKEGDWVLSKPENGGEQAYKRVLKTFAHAPTRVMRVRYFLGDDWNHCYPITTTLNHPFWVVDQGWMAAKDLGDEIGSGGKKLELSDGSQVTIQGTGNIYVSEQPGVGWLPSHSGSTDWPGYLWDYVNHRLMADRVPALKKIQDKVHRHHSHFLKLPVYNLEVEDYHTYYVGKHGVWVHNKNGNGLGITVKGSLTQLSDDMLPFLSLTPDSFSSI